jgi:hypothetical protein
MEIAMLQRLDLETIVAVSGAASSLQWPAG